jgi:hypothetical protein
MASPLNKPMHPTADTNDFIISNRVGRRGCAALDFFLLPGHGVNFIPVNGKEISYGYGDL